MTQQKLQNLPGKISLWAIGGFIAQCAGIILAITIWCYFLEYSPSPSKIRLTMTVITLMITLAELLLCWLDYLNGWAAVVILMANIWGSLDATQRFPATVFQDPWGLFTVKVTLLWLGKIVGLCVFFKQLRKYPMVLLGVLLVHVAFLPLMHLLALPIGEDTRTQQILSQDVVDEDMLIKLWRQLMNSRERQETIQALRRRMNAFFILCGKKSPLFAQILTTLDSSYKRALRRESRSI